MFDIDDDVFVMFILTFGMLFAIIRCCIILNPDF